MKNIYLFLFLCILCSCGTSKRTTNIDRTYSDYINLIDTTVLMSDVLVLEKLMENKRLDAKIIITEYSCPDSIGRQYPVKLTEVVINSETNNSSERNIDGNVTINTGLAIDTERTRSEQIREAKSRFIIPGWWYQILFLILVVIGGIIYVKRI